MRQVFLGETEFEPPSPDPVTELSKQGRGTHRLSRHPAIAEEVLLGVD
jgi:hypothetical protein